MVKLLEELVAEAADVFAAQLKARLTGEADLRGLDAGALGSQAASWAIASVDSGNGSPLARRIGPVYRVEQLTRWLVAPGAHPLSEEAVRKRIKHHQLVAFRTDDRQWALPGWQFDRLAGRLVPRGEVIGLWQRLTIGSLYTDADLAAWMNTRLAGFGTTPVSYASQHGVDDPALVAAVKRLVVRAA